MSQLKPEFEISQQSAQSIRYLEHGWPSDLCRWHAHQNYELHLITANTGTAIIGDYIGEFKTGDLFLIGPMLPHNWVCHDDQQEVAIRDRLLQFSHDKLINLCQSFSEFNVIKPLLKKAKQGVQFIGYDAHKANQQLMQIRDATGTQMICFFLALLEQLVNHSDIKVLSSGTEFSKLAELEEKKITAVVSYVMEHFQDKLTIDAVAHHVGMNRSNFSRYFHRKTGTRFNDFVNQVRIGQVCNLLIESDNNIADICYDAGFNNLSNFNRRFQLIKGLTPKEYRFKVRQELL